MTKYYRDSENNYVGAYDGATPPGGSIEVALPPNHGTDVWDGSSWSARTLTPAEVIEVQRLIDIATAQNNSGLKSVGIETANNFIDFHMDAITDLASAKEEITIILKRMIPYLLK